MPESMNHGRSQIAILQLPPSIFCEPRDLPFHPHQTAADVRVAEAPSEPGEGEQCVVNADLRFAWAADCLKGWIPTGQRQWVQQNIQDLLTAERQHLGRL